MFGCRMNRSAIFGWQNLEVRFGIGNPMVDFFLHKNHLNGAIIIM